MKPPSPKEAEIQKATLDWLGYNGIFAFRLNNIPVPLKGGGFRPVRQKGLPDIIAYIPRRKGFAVPVMIEIKRKGGRVSPEQERVLSDADHAGVLCIVADNLQFVIDSLAPYL